LKRLVFTGSFHNADKNFDSPEIRYPNVLGGQRRW
jgi:hypothetical protein